MNKVRQFWALFKFQAVLKPFIFLMPLALATPYYITYITRSIGHDFHPDLHLLLANQNLFFVAWIGFMLLDPEGFQVGVSTAMWGTGSEFLLTRAVDRHLVLRARSAFFFVIILAIPLCASLCALKNPSLEIGEYNQIIHRQVLDRIAGSIALPPNSAGKSQGIIIPNGNILIDSWRIWLFLCVAVGTQMFILVVFRLKYRRFISWGVLMGVILLPLLKIILSKGSNFDVPNTNEAIFLTFAAHQWIFWLMTIMALFLSQLWCERRFAAMEQ